MAEEVQLNPKTGLRLLRKHRAGLLKELDRDRKPRRSPGAT